MLNAGTCCSAHDYGFQSVYLWILRRTCKGLASTCTQGLPSKRKFASGQVAMYSAMRARRTVRRTISREDLCLTCRNSSPEKGMRSRASSSLLLISEARILQSTTSGHQELRMQPNLELQSTQTSLPSIKLGKGCRSTSQLHSKQF